MPSFRRTGRWPFPQSVPRRPGRPTIVLRSQRRPFWRPTRRCDVGGRHDGERRRPSDAPDRATRGHQHGQRQGVAAGADGERLRLTTETDRSDADPDTNPTVDAGGGPAGAAQRRPLANEERLGDPTDGSDADRPTGPSTSWLRVPDSLADGQLGARRLVERGDGRARPGRRRRARQGGGRASSASRSNGATQESRSSCATPPSPSSGP